MGCLYIHGSDRLTVLDGSRISCGTAHYYDIKSLFHIIFQLLVDHGLICHGEITQMDTFRCVLINAAYHVLIDFFCHERDHGCCTLADLNKCRIQCHVGIDLILFHTLCPETVSAAAHIPVTHLIHKVIQYSGSLRDPVMIQMIIYLLDRCI